MRLDIYYTHSDLGMFKIILLLEILNVTNTKHEHYIITVYHSFSPFTFTA